MTGGRARRPSTPPSTPVRPPGPWPGSCRMRSSPSKSGSRDSVRPPASYATFPGLSRGRRARRAGRRETARLIARGEDGHDLALVRRAGEQALGDAYGWWTGHSSWIDVTVRGVSKATGVERAAASLGFDAADVLAVGDGLNDVELLSWAGWGVAMGHAPSGVRDIADAVTSSVARRRRRRGHPPLLPRTERDH